MFTKITYYTIDDGEGVFYRMGTDSGLDIFLEMYFDVDYEEIKKGEDVEAVLSIYDKDDNRILNGMGYFYEMLNLIFKTIKEYN